MTPMAQAISAALVHFTWEGLAVAFLLWVTLAAMRNSAPRLRYAVSSAALAVMSALPLITMCIVYRVPGAAMIGSDGVIDIPNVSGSAALSAAGFLPQWVVAIEGWALPVWFGGVTLFAIRFIWSTRHAAMLRRGGESAGDSVNETVKRLARRMNVLQPVGVFTSRLTDSPSVLGWLRPVILIPVASVLNLSPNQLEAVLVHELAHIRRRDYLINLLQTVAEMLFFYQPAIWWVSSRMRTERELCCDDIVVEACGNPVEYARALTQLERLRIGSPKLAMSSTAGPLMFRIQRLTGVAPKQPASRLPAAFAAGLAIICLMTDTRWALAQPQGAGEAVVRREAIFVDTIKFGDFPVTVRALGAIPNATTAELSVASQVSDLVQVGQRASIELQQGITASGKVARIDSRAVNGTVPVSIQLQASLGEYVGRTVDGLIQIRTLKDVTFMARPAGPTAGSETTIFKLEPDGGHAIRVKIRFGAPSATHVQVLGLAAGDRVILSDLSKYDGYNRIRLE